MAAEPAEFAAQSQKPFDAWAKARPPPNARPVDNASVAGTQCGLGRPPRSHDLARLHPAAPGMLLTLVGVTWCAEAEDCVQDVCVPEPGRAGVRAHVHRRAPARPRAVPVDGGVAGQSSHRGYRRPTHQARPSLNPLTLQIHTCGCQETHPTLLESGLAEMAKIRLIIVVFGCAIWLESCEACCGERTRRMPCCRRDLFLVASVIIVSLFGSFRSACPCQVVSTPAWLGVLLPLP